MQPIAFLKDRLKQEAHLEYRHCQNPQRNRLMIENRDVRPWIDAVKYISAQWVKDLNCNLKLKRLTEEVKLFVMAHHELAGPALHQNKWSVKG